METLILDGAMGADSTAGVLHAALRGELDLLGSTVESVHIADSHIGPCMGDFLCWTRSPGLCAQNDDNRAIARAFVQSDLVVLLTPLTFGGYSSELKRALDHMIQTISPFFTTVAGESHHAARYARYPRLLAFGWRADPGDESEAIFHHLVERNAVNLHAPASMGGVVRSAWTPPQVRQAAADMLHEVLHASGHTPTPLPDIPVMTSGRAPQRALLLTGSPKGKKSTSQSLGAYLLDRLEALGMKTHTIRLYTTLKSEANQRALLAAVDEADLVVLAFPLYVDCLPAPVISTLERIAAHRRASPASKTQTLAALVNCGFPEARHNDGALAICGRFAHEVGFGWAGGLGLGGGQGIVGGIPVAELGGRGAAIRASLDQTAEALARGASVPEAAVALMARPLVPAWVYRMQGRARWLLTAYHKGALRGLGARPYA